MTEPNDLLAVLVDADNVSPARIGAVLAEIAQYGTASVKRIYGDWTKPNLRGWKDSAREHVIQPIQQFDNTTGKNATDSALIIDAMDLLYTGRFGGFCIISSDSDFTRLAARIREQGLTVYGFGERKTPESFRNACDRFTYMDVLEKDDVLDAVEVPVPDFTAPNTPTADVAARDTPAADTPAAGVPTDVPTSARTKVPTAQLRKNKAVVSLLRNSVNTASGDDGWARLSAVGTLARKQQPDFDARNWGYTKLSDLIRAIDLFTLETKPGGVRVRLR